MGVRLIDIAMQALWVRHRNPETGRHEMAPFLEHHMVSDPGRDRKRQVGTVRIHDAFVKQLVELSDVCLRLPRAA